SSDLLQHFQKQVAASGSAEQRLSTIATARNEMQIASAIVAMKILPHGYRIRLDAGGGSDTGHHLTVMKKSGGCAIVAGGPLLENREKWRTPRFLDSSQNPPSLPH